MRIPWLGWYFSLLHVSLKEGLLILVCVFNKNTFTKDQSLMTIEFRKKYYGCRRTALSIFGITIIEEEFKIERVANESKS